MADKKDQVNLPRRVVDPHYRYKMPVLKTQITGKHQGRSTVIPNLADIARALDRPPIYIMKYFGGELNTRVKCDDKNGEFSVHGSYTSEELALVLDKFIDGYVLSDVSTYPETDLIVKRGKIILHCRACGEDTYPDMSHKLSSYILKNPPSKIGFVQQKGQQMRRTGKTGQQDEPALASNVIQSKEGAEAGWSVDTSREAVEKRRKEMMGADGEENDEDPVQTLFSIAAKEPPMEQAAFVRKVLELKKVTGWNERKTIQMVFVALFDENIAVQADKRAPLLEPFVQAMKDQGTVLNCFEKLCQSRKTVIPHTSTILNAFYDHDVLEEDILNKWYKHPNKKMDKKLSAAIRSKGKAFIEWLANAEEDSDEEDSDEYDSE